MSRNTTRRDRTPGILAPKSVKLERTLKELESAFTDWEKITSAKTRVPVPDPEAQKAKDLPVQERDFRKKTKKLLNQLRQQLADLDN